MGIKRPPRLRQFTYRGKYRYFLTICTAEHYAAFEDSGAAAPIVAQFLQHAENFTFAILAYCVMTDHLHALVQGHQDDSDFRRFVTRFKQRTGFDWKRRTGRTLWQEGYYDRVLREEETDAGVIAYIAANPVEAGLAASCTDYPLFGSTEYSTAHIVEFLRQWEQERAIRFDD